MNCTGRAVIYEEYHFKDVRPAPVAFAWDVKNFSWAMNGNIFKHLDTDDDEIVRPEATRGPVGTFHVPSSLTASTLPCTVKGIRIS